ncbi:MAG: hypothetical protein K2J48_11275 [Muribaculaceae bacterium]|nr:hypothetical protein [Muribaculaceae bacterium]MDE6008396.1 hypothetical protein [Muribaculaceae bacterium]MDE6793649.1 hypothetical protein [Muribaculaceae bacterium]
MRHEDILKEKYGTDPGFRVPDGYFEKLQKEIMDSLPAYPETPRHVPVGLWQRVKPYVYLAAMFAGIWLMMKVFVNVSNSSTLSLDNPPEAIVQVLGSDTHDYDIYYPSESDIILEEEVSSDYESIEEFKEDFFSTEDSFAND